MVRGRLGVWLGRVGPDRQRAADDALSAAESIQFGFEPRHEVVELIDDGADGVGLTEIDAGLAELFHRVIVSA